MPEPLGYHVVCRLVDGRVIAPTVEARRVLAVAVVGTSRGHAMLAFGLPDTHLHFACVGNRATVGRLTQRMELSLRRRLGIPVAFAGAQLIEIESQRHLARAFAYVLRQQERHGLSNDLYHEGSSLPDLLGLRAIGAEAPLYVQQLLPRTRRDQLLDLLGVRHLEEATGPVELVLDATLSACGVNSLQGRGPDVRGAVRAATAVLEPQVGVMQAARLLGVHRKRLTRMRNVEPNPSLTHAIRLQLGLRRAKARQAGLAA